MLYFPFFDSMEAIACRTLIPSPYSVGWSQPFSKRDMKLVFSCHVFMPEVKPYLPISLCGIFLGELVFGPRGTATWIEDELLQISPVGRCHVQEKYHF